jgi:hypothetical protein
MKPLPLDGCTSEPLAAYLKALALLSHGGEENRHFEAAFQA